MNRIPNDWSKMCAVGGLLGVWLKQMRGFGFLPPACLRVLVPEDTKLS